MQFEKLWLINVRSVWHYGSTNQTSLAKFAMSRQILWLGPGSVALCIVNH